MQPFCPYGNTKFVQFGSKVEFTKMRTKTCFIRFFKDSLNKRAGTPTLKLDEGNVSTFAKFKYERSSSKTEQVLEKKNMISCFFFRKEDKLLGWKSILCSNVTSLEKGKWLILLLKDLKHNRHQRGKKNYDNCYYYDDDDDDDDYDDDDNDDDN